MAARELTDVVIRKLKPVEGRQIEVFDGKMPAFGLRISPGGAKAFVLLYRAGRKSRRLTLGRYPALSLAEARQRAQKALSTVAAGKDPANLKAQARASYEADLFPTLLNDFIENYAKRKTRGWRENERLLRREFESLWKRRLARDLTKRDVNEVLDGIVGRGSPSAANHAFAAIRKLFSWSVERGYLEHSPCFGVRLPSKLVSRSHVLSDAELVAVWLGADSLGYPFGRVAQLLILTAQRRGEVIGMSWLELDLLNAIWTIPGSRTKSGREHVVPLTPLTLQLIASLPRVHERLLFPAKGREAVASGFSKWKKALDEKSGLKNWRLHDLRRTVATKLAQSRIQPHVIERLLNHSGGTLGGVAGVYNRYAYLDEVRAALESWEQKIDAIVRT